MTLTEFLLARIAEDEAAARGYPEPHWKDGPGGIGISGSPSSFLIVHDTGAAPTALAHIARWDPARVLAECEAKRRIVEHAQHWERTLTETSERYDESHCTMYRMAMHWVLDQMAAVYADHPDYDPTWRA